METWHEDNIERRKMKILITGVTGFAGSHLADLCLAEGDDVWGLCSSWRSNLKNINHIINQVANGTYNHFHFFPCDIRDSIAVSTFISKHKFDVIFHLAAQSFVPASWTNPLETMRTNVEGTINILEACRVFIPNCVIQIAGSSEEYGTVEDGRVIKETDSLNPLSPYGVSKVTQDLLGYQYFKSYAMKIIRTRAFNHEGARRPNKFVLSSFVEQFVKIIKGLQEPVIKHGNLDAVRDFTHVKDTMSAYYCLAQRAFWGDIRLCGEVFNICTGVVYSMREVLAMILVAAFNRYGKERCKLIDFQQDSERMRPSDVPYLRGDNTKIREAIGWEPRRTLAFIISDLFDYWEQEYSNEKMGKI